MQYFLKTCLIILCCSAGLSAQSGDRQAYINKYKNIAIREMERAGIPASIKLAQGLLESGAGTSYLARKANNHFGMKCGSSWTGRKVYRKDDDYDEFGRLQKSCFRGYKSAEESYIAHSEFLRDPRKEHRYGFLFRYPVTDYKRWARGLKRSGYATSATYDTKLIRIIESYELYRFDRLSSVDIRDEWDADDLEPVAGLDLRRINDVKVVFASRGDTPEEIGNKVDVNPKRIVKYNERLNEVTDKLESNERIYIQPKRKNFRGRKKWHYVQEGETMYKISQLYGIRLNKLYKRNLLPVGSEPEIGERLKIRGWKISSKERPRLRKGFQLAPDQPTFEEEDPFMDEENAIDIDPSDVPENDPIIETEDPDNDFPTEDPIIEDPVTSPDPPVIDEPVIISPPEGGNVNQPPGGEEYYVVQKGDNLYRISIRFKTSVDDIKRMNGLFGTTIFPGQKLRVK